jgi:hypothetical protein
MATVKVSRDRQVQLDGETIGSVYGEPRDWWYLHTDGHGDGPWHSKQEAADMLARVHRKRQRAANA